MQSMSGAAKSTARELFEDDENPEDLEGFAQLQENVTIRIVVFLFGALPQVIKLFAFTGVSGTQICASLFLGSFTMNEIIMWWLRWHRDTVRNADAKPAFLDSFAMNEIITWWLRRHQDIARNANAEPDLLNDLFMKETLLWWLRRHPDTVRAAKAEPHFMQENNFAIIYSSYSTALSSIYGIASFRINTEQDDSANSKVYWTLGMIFIIFVIFGSLDKAILKDSAICDGPSPKSTGKWTRPVFDRLIVFVNACWQGVLGILLANALPAIFTEYTCIPFLSIITTFWIFPFKELKLERSLGWHLFFFMLLHLLAAFLIYLFKYDSKGTYKPPWTNQLG